MFRLAIRILIWFVRLLFKSEHDLRIENLALRQQLAVFKMKHPRPKLQSADQAFWVALRTAGPQWKNALILVQSSTVTKWHRRALQKRAESARILDEVRMQVVVFINYVDARGRVSKKAACRTNGLCANAGALAPVGVV